MKRLITDSPKTNQEILLNFAYIKNGKVKLRRAYETDDINLSQVVSLLAMENLFECHPSPEEIEEGVCSGFCCTADGNCICAVLNTVATQAAELREELKHIENNFFWKERKTEPPKKSDHYLCIVLGSKVPLVLYYHADICTFTEFEDEYDPIYPVTHWMKLPKPPKEVEYEK